MDSKCTPFSGYIMPNGYGSLYCKIKKVTVPAHRRAWEKENGPIPEGLEICHMCDNRRCVNVEHMFLGTRSENMIDASRKGRLNNHCARKTHCKRGHKFTGENTRISPDGFRVCKTCRREWQREAVRKKNAS